MRIYHLAQYYLCTNSCIHLVSIQRQTAYRDPTQVGLGSGIDKPSENYDHSEDTYQNTGWQINLRNLNILMTFTPEHPDYFRNHSYHEPLSPNGYLCDTSGSNISWAPSHILLPIPQMASVMNVSQNSLLRPALHLPLATPYTISSYSTLSDALNMAHLPSLSTHTELDESLFEDRYSTTLLPYDADTHYSTYSTLTNAFLE